MNAFRRARPSRHMLSVGRELVAEHDTEAVLDRVLQEAVEITTARYAALGVLDESRSQLERFITVGMDPATRRSIGDLPRGRGVLGVLIEDPRPLRLPDVGQHPRSYGFPVGHPEMHTFLGVPILIGGEAWGNLYLAEKQGGVEFTAGGRGDRHRAGAMGGGRDRERAAVRAQRAATRAARAGRPVTGSVARHRRCRQRRG